MDEKKHHWENIYSTKTADKLSWAQARPSPSIEWILEAVPDRKSAVIDVGGGTSTLVDHLLEAGYMRPAVLDISSTALDQAKIRLGEKANSVEWIEANITSLTSSRKFSLWHDRAVFHFLTIRTDRELYIEALEKSLMTGGFAIIATFSPQGPTQCSGLNVMRFDEKSLKAELGDDFRLVRSENHVHLTPWGTEQAFTYCLFSRI
jgi:trans-aconitate methyltransferase